MNEESEYRTDAGETVTGRPIPGTSGRYIATRDGRFFSVGPTQRIRELKQQTTAAGYRTVSIAGKNHRAHRVICTTYHGAPPAEGLDVAHNNGNPADNRPENLRWATRAENIADQKKHGTHYTLHPNQKIRDLVAIKVAVNKWRAAQRRNAEQT